ncbi:glycosyltransferase [Paenibacillus nuruki]|uniref:glycosyltransferase n=1 Tax=Paenibacillus nuruki TaxID=1886670 RepID=UPI0028053DE9|nr:glycosyltransferase [Paenibacillus nuruki]
MPVYNAREELEECVASLLRHTDLENNRIIIIDDKSPDPSVNEYLMSMEKHKNIIVLQNENNLGFVGTVNKGMRYSLNDVVLLNSDTVVTKRWMEKLREVAYSDTSIATVTPLTNNGSICSIPLFLEDNPIPDGYTVDSFAYFVEKISLKLYPEVPTAVGFCMYIKRSVIEEIGFFDDETFGKGYAEENDFCCRVIEHGYRNVIDDHTFIYHKGSMSFQGEKLNLLNKNLKILNERYPYYDKNVHDFIVRNPLKSIHNNVQLRLPHFFNQCKTKGNILYVLHNFFDENYTQPIGGTEYHVKDIVTELKEYYAFILVTNGTEIVLKQYLEGEFVAKYHFPLRDPISIQHFHHQEYSDLIEKILNTFDISLVHIHHLIRHSFDIPHVAAQNNIPVLFTLHDYYLFTPGVNLLDENNEYIYKDENSDEVADQKISESLRKTYGFNTEFIKKWREKVEEMIEKVDFFLTPCTFTKQFFESRYSSIEGKISAIPHGVTIESNLTGSRIPYVKSEKTEIKEWNIGFLGGLAPNKGSNIIYELITKYRKNNVKWHLVGGLGDHRLNILNQNNVIKYGEYKREELSNILENLDLDLVCLLSPWPETFSYTLSEAWLHDIPALVTPMGALKERVIDVDGGWITDSVELQDIINKLTEVMNSDISEWNTIKDNIKNHRFKTKKEMAQQYIEIYNEKAIFLEHKLAGIANEFENRQIIKAISYYMPVNNNLTVEDYNNQMYYMEQELNNMRNSIGWKVLNKLRSENNWLLNIGKKCIHLFLKVKRR